MLLSLQRRQVGTPSVQRSCVPAGLWVWPTGGAHGAVPWVLGPGVTVGEKRVSKKVCRVPVLTPAYLETGSLQMQLG